MPPLTPALLKCLILILLLISIGTPAFFLYLKIKRLSGKYRRLQTRYNNLLQIQSEGICYYKPDKGMLFDPNPVFSGWFPMLRDASTGIEIFCTSGHIDDAAVFRKLAEQALQDTPQTFELQIQDAGDSALWLRIRLQAQIVDDRRLLLIRATDITEFKYAESESKRFSSILESIGEGVITTDLAGYITYANKAWANIHGFSQSELTGKHQSIFYSPEQLKNDVLPFNEIVLRKGKHSGEVGHRHANGAEFFTYMTTALKRDKAGRPEGYIGAATDLTEQKKIADALRASEIKFRHLFNLSPEPISVSDLTGKILDANEKFCEFLNYTRRSVIGKTALDLGFPADQWQQIINTLTAKGELTGFEVSFKNQNQTTWHLLMFAKLVEIKNEFFILSILHDITKQRQLEDRLRESQKLEAIGTLAGGIAHDFNNILSAILGYVELSMIKTDRESKVFNYLDQVLKAANRARDLVRQILSVSRQTEQRKKPVSVRPIIEDVLKLMRASLPSSVEICEEIEHHKGPILADPGQIHQILMNLCTNAGQSMNETGGVLTVALDTVKIGMADISSSFDIPPGSYVRIAVSDTGHGMSPEVQKRIFDPYFTTKVKGMGTGLGLAVVQGIVKKHGGAVTFSSRSGSGTRFCVYLPMIQRLGTSRTETAADAEISLPRGNERILLIDDEEAITDTARQMLEFLGYDVTTSLSSIEAHSLFCSDPGRFDLVITDMTMPDMSGDELARRLMDIRPDIPIMLCTGYSARIDEQIARNMGVRALVFKPIKLRALANLVREILENAPEKQAAES